jgi:tetratricopeptide (TPR) repeat protein
LSRILNNDLSDTILNSVLNSIDYEKPIEITVIKLYNLGLRDCNKLKNYTNLLLKINPRNSNAYYIKGVCEEITGSLEKSAIFFGRALNVSPYNPDYLAAAAIIQFKLGEFDNTKVLLGKYKIISRDSSKIRDLESRLMQEITK